VRPSEGLAKTEPPISDELNVLDLPKLLLFVSDDDEVVLRDVKVSLQDIYDDLLSKDFDTFEYVALIAEQKEGRLLQSSSSNTENRRTIEVTGVAAFQNAGQSTSFEQLDGWFVANKFDLFQKIQQAVPSISSMEIGDEFVSFIGDDYTQRRTRRRLRLGLIFGGCAIILLALGWIVLRWCRASDRDGRIQRKETSSVALADESMSHADVFSLEDSLRSSAMGGRAGSAAGASSFAGGSSLAVQSTYDATRLDAVLRLTKDDSFRRDFDDED